MSSCLVNTVQLTTNADRQLLISFVSSSYLYEILNRMKIKIEHEIKVSELELTEQELLDHFITTKRYSSSMLKIADKALSEVNWHNNMPKSSKLEYISMLTKHIDALMKDIDHNYDLCFGK